MAKTAFTRDQLLSFISRIERLREERAALNADIKEVFAEATGIGFDGPTMRRVIKIRAQGKAKVQEEQAMLDLYLEAVGFDSTPLGAASQKAA